MSAPHGDHDHADIPPPAIEEGSDGVYAYVDGLRLEVQFMGPAHTANDVIAWLPDRRLLFSGDIVFNGGTPFVVMGSVAGSLVALDRLRALQPEVIVPGHGGVCGPDAID